MVNGQKELTTQGVDNAKRWRAEKKKRNIDRYDREKKQDGQRVMIPYQNYLCFNNFSQKVSERPQQKRIPFMWLRREGRRDSETQR